MKTKKWQKLGVTTLNGRIIGAIYRRIRDGRIIERLYMPFILGIVVGLLVSCASSAPKPVAVPAMTVDVSERDESKTSSSFGNAKSVLRADQYLHPALPRKVLRLEHEDGSVWHYLIWSRPNGKTYANDSRGGRAIAKIPETKQDCHILLGEFKVAKMEYLPSRQKQAKFSLGNRVFPVEEKMSCVLEAANREIVLMQEAKKRPPMEWHRFLYVQYGGEAKLSHCYLVWKTLDGQYFAADWKGDRKLYKVESDAPEALAKTLVEKVDLAWFD